MSQAKHTLRGHHLLCVHGFKGMGYSPEFVQKMTEIVADIRDESSTFHLRVVLDLDEACAVCPHNGGTGCAASPGSDAHVRQLDARIMARLGVEHGRTYDKEWLVQHTAETVEPEDLDDLCRGCSWLRHGVCKEGLALLKKKRLPAKEA